MRIPLILLLVLYSTSVYASSYSGVLIAESSSKEFISSVKSYVLKVETISDEQEIVLLSLNGELSDTLHEREKHRFSDGSLVVVGDIITNEGEETTSPDLVQLYFVSGGSYEMGSSDSEYDLGPLMDEATLTEEAVVVADTVKPVECISSGNCNDGNACSTDSCVNGECVHEFKTGCSLLNQCVPVQQVVVNGAGAKAYCAASGNLIAQKADGASCKEHFECLGECSSGVCVTEAPEVSISQADRPAAPVAEPLPRNWLQRFWDWLTGSN